MNAGSSAPDRFPVSYTVYGGGFNVTAESNFPTTSGTEGRPWGFEGYVQTDIVVPWKERAHRRSEHEFGTNFLLPVNKWGETPKQTIKRIIEPCVRGFYRKITIARVQRRGTTERQYAGDLVVAIYINPMEGVSVGRVRKLVYPKVLHFLSSLPIPRPRIGVLIHDLSLDKDILKPMLDAYTMFGAEIFKGLVNEVDSVSPDGAAAANVASPKSQAELDPMLIEDYGSSSPPGGSVMDADPSSPPSEDFMNTDSSSPPDDSAMDNLVETTESLLVHRQEEGFSEWFDYHAAYT